MIFNASKRPLTDLHFYFMGEEIEINTTHTYMGVQFTGPRFGMRQALQPRLNKGYGSLALIKRWYFQGQFQDISSKLYLMEEIIRPTVLYGSEIWGYKQFGFGWREFKPCFSNASSDANIQLHNPLFRQSSVSNHFTSRLSFV
jgi:hypothetical protein